MHLQSVTLGDRTSSAVDSLFAACRHELRAAAANLMRGERRPHTLQPTELVHEAYLRLFHVDVLPAESRTHFVNIAARVMRQVLVEHARRRNAAKRGGGARTITLSGAEMVDGRDEIGVLELNEALDKLADLDRRAAEIVELRVFGGLTMDEIAALVGVSRRTVQKDWRFATLWLRRQLAVEGEARA
ncbi:sigma-70 family RNA polymerase sigma factor [bacterium]|nr:sigma-70 family RNA polymerase sigma factor [bacterium]